MTRRNIDIAVSKLEVKLNLANSPTDQRRVIRRVPLMLRNRTNLIEYFEPRGVSIGPLHYGKENLQAAEDLKSKLPKDFIKTSGYTTKQLYELVESNIENLAEFYADEVRKKFDLDELAQILLVDGCALLHFILHVVHPRCLKKLNIKNDWATFAQQDVFLLENQLPFRLLDLLMSNNPNERKLRKSIQHLVRMNAMVVMPDDKCEVPISHEWFHLLDLLRTTLLFGGGGSNENEHSAVLVDVELKEEEEDKEGWPTFRNVQELKTAGVYVKRLKKRKGLDIEFQSGMWGRLKIPGITVDYSTQPKFLNLVAYEMCPEFNKDFEVTSYICLLYSLIDQAEDVKELRKENIIQNLLGSDEELAKLFNEIGTDLVPNPEIYLKVKNEIQKQFNSRLSRWIGEGYHNYFTSPWSFLAFIGVLISLICSLIQAWYSPKSDPPCLCKTP